MTLDLELRNCTAPAGPTEPLPAPTARFAPLATPAFDVWFAAELTAMAEEMAWAAGPTFRALVLGGGYGRGEGGVVWRDGVERPYNDIDLFLFAERPAKIDAEALRPIARRYHLRLGVDVDVSRPYRPEDVERWRPTLMWHELAAGHIVLRGPAGFLEQRLPSCVRQAPPVSEALRLLLNRGAGLLWAMRVLTDREAAPDADFVRRNLYKCALACGDALLITHGAYGSSFAGRDRRLASLLADRSMPGAAALGCLYGKARQFKLSPDAVAQTQPSMDDLQEVAALWSNSLLSVERTRAGLPLPTLEAYAEWNGSRESPHASLWVGARQLAANLRAGRLSWRHPRDPLYRELPRLLNAASVQSAGWAAASERFLDRWRRAC